LAIGLVDDDDQLGAEALELTNDLGAGALDDTHHHDDGADPDDHAQHGERRAELVAAEVAEGRLKAAKKVHRSVDIDLDRASLRAVDDVGLHAFALPQSGEDLDVALAAQADAHPARREGLDGTPAGDRARQDLDSAVRSDTVDALQRQA